MTPPALLHTIHACRRLHEQGREGDAVGLIERSFEPQWEQEASYWMWLGALLFWAGRHQEAEQVLRDARIRPDWPEGNPGITFWLAEVLLWKGHHDEVESITAIWANRGDADCGTMHTRALLALGRTQEALQQARQRASAMPSHVGAQLVLLEALVDCGADKRGSCHAESAHDLVRKLRNMRELQMPFNAYQVNKLEKLVQRMERPFGFRRA